MHGKLSGSRYEESLKLAVELAKRGESEGIGTVYRETCADVYFRARLMMGNRGEARELVRQVYLVVFRTISTLQDTTDGDGSVSQFFISLVNGNVVEEDHSGR